MQVLADGVAVAGRGGAGRVLGWRPGAGVAAGEGGAGGGCGRGGGSGARLPELGEGLAVAGGGDRAGTRAEKGARALGVGRGARREARWRRQTEATAGDGRAAAVGREEGEEDVVEREEDVVGSGRSGPARRFHRFRVRAYGEGSRRRRGCPRRIGFFFIIAFIKFI